MEQVTIIGIDLAKRRAGRGGSSGQTRLPRHTPGSASASGVAKSGNADRKGAQAGWRTQASGFCRFGQDACVGWCALTIASENVL